ncbi:MAG TPA: hypothetical protein VJ836_00465 [Candidatus Saccharimonadales bacterium]|nr:hypothetical protein [Candidatus Saccharimonadales bacterium]
MLKPSNDSDKTYLDSWLRSLSQAEKMLAEDSGLPADYTPESLLGYWEWMQSHCELRHPFGDPLENDPSKVPEWAKREGLQRIRSAVTIPTLELMGCMARYYGECLQRAVPKAQWRIWKWGVKGYAVHGDDQVALCITSPDEVRTFGDPIFPIHDIDVMVMRTIAPPPHPESTDFIAMYRMRIQSLQEGVRHLTANDRT